MSLLNTNLGCAQKNYQNISLIHLQESVLRMLGAGARSLFGHQVFGAKLLQ